MQARSISFLVALLAAVPVVARAQAVEAGMSRADVIERLGEPVGERTRGATTYLFYDNGCGRRCTSDVVTLEGDVVVDVLRRAGGTRRVVRRRNAAAGRRRGGNLLPDTAAQGGLVIGGTEPATPTAGGAAPGGRPARAGGAAGQPGPRVANPSAAARGVPAGTDPSAPSARPSGSIQQPVARDAVTRGDSVTLREATPVTTVPGPATPQPPNLGQPPGATTAPSPPTPFRTGQPTAPYVGARPSSLDSMRAVRRATDSVRADSARTP